MTRVVWEIDVDETDPVRAAEEALAVQRDPQSIATVFSVKPEDSDKAFLVDLRCITAKGAVL